MKNQLNILMIEDSENDAELIIRFLEKSNYSIISERVESSEQLIVALKKQSWDIVISDFQLPGLDALDALSIFQKNSPDSDIPFIVVSGTIGEEKAVNIMKSGAHDYVMKDNLYKLPSVVNRELIEAQNRRERKKAEEDLRRSDEWAKLIFDNTNDIMFLVSIEPDFVFRCVRVNPAYLKLTGLRLSQVIGKTAEEILHEKVALNAIKMYKEVVQTGKLISYEEVALIRAKNVIVETTLKPIANRDGQPAYILGVARDITEQKKMEEVLLDSEGRFRSLYDRMMDGAYTSTPEGRFVNLNQAMVEMFGYASKEEMMAIDIKSELYFDPQEREHLNQGMLVGSMDVYLMRKKDGTEIWVEDNGSYIRDQNGQILYHEGILRDVTERRKAEEELNKSFVLVRSQNERLLNFAYIVSHNLRSHTSNLSGILGIMENTDSKEERAEMLDLLNKTSDSLNETIDNLNDVVSIQTSLNLNISSLSLNEHIGKAIVILHDQIALKNAKIINNVPEDILISYNPAYLESILLNFLSNAIKYSHPDRQPEIMIDIERIEKYFILSIKDNGMGIDLKKYGEKLFGLYKTFHGNSDAKGIGLFISKNQIEVMGGKIEVESELDKGSTFKIYFAI